MSRIELPTPEEYAPYYGKYVALVGPDPLTQLESLAISTPRLLAATDEAKAMYRYAEGKWSVKEVIGHLSDAERVFAYRALRIGRADPTDLAGFDENDYVRAAHFDRRTLVEVAAEFASVRAATLALFRSFDAAELLRRGTANGNVVSVRALAAILAGHELHHVALLRERYALAG